ncbi:MAG: hypothetical protein ACRC0L_00110, partial [Angustibacter sp.]
PGELRLGAVTSAATAGLALIGVGIALLAGRGGVDPATRLPNWWRDLGGPGRALDDRLVIAQRRLVLHPTATAARGIAWADERLIEALNEGTRRLIGGLGAAISLAQTGAITGYLRWLWLAALGAIVAGVSWR